MIRIDSAGTPPLTRCVSSGLFTTDVKKKPEAVLCLNEL